jgi:hypothetical protein
MPLPCCTPEEFKHWKRPAVSLDAERDGLTEYKPGQYGNNRSVEVGFCKEADHQRCREIRAKGLCARTGKDYEKMVRDVSRRKVMI